MKKQISLPQNTKTYTEIMKVNSQLKLSETEQAQLLDTLKTQRSFVGNILGPDWEASGVLLNTGEFVTCLHNVIDLRHCTDIWDTPQTAKDNLIQQLQTITVQFTSPTGIIHEYKVAGLSRDPEGKPYWGFDKFIIGGLSGYNNDFVYLKLTGTPLEDIGAGCSVSSRFEIHNQACVTISGRDDTPDGQSFRYASLGNSYPHANGVQHMTTLSVTKKMSGSPVFSLESLRKGRPEIVSLVSHVDRSDSGRRYPTTCIQLCGNRHMMGYEGNFMDDRDAELFRLKQQNYRTLSTKEKASITQTLSVLVDYTRREFPYGINVGKNRQYPISSAVLAVPKFGTVPSTLHHIVPAWDMKFIAELLLRTEDGFQLIRGLLNAAVLDDTGKTYLDYILDHEFTNLDATQKSEYKNISRADLSVNAGRYEAFTSRMKKLFIYLPLNLIWGPEGRYRQDDTAKGVDTSHDTPCDYIPASWNPAYQEKMHELCIVIKDIVGNGTANDAPKYSEDASRNLLIAIFQSFLQLPITPPTLQSKMTDACKSDWAYDPVKKQYSLIKYVF